jgi:RNase P subunit RPR2
MIDNHKYFRLADEAMRSANQATTQEKKRDGLPIKPPVCPECRKAMALESGEPDIRYVNLHHMMFKCESCGWEFGLPVCLRPAPTR